MCGIDLLVGLVMVLFSVIIVVCLLYGIGVVFVVVIVIGFVVGLFNGGFVVWFGIDLLIFGFVLFVVVCGLV